MRIPLKYLPLLFVLQLSFVTTGFTATITSKLRTQIVRPGDPIELTITLKTEGGEDIGDLEIPKMSGLEVVNQQQSSSVGIQVINGKFSRSTTQTSTLILSTDKEGTFEIPPIRIKVSGKNYQTRPYKIVVTDKAPPAPDPQEDEDLDPFSLFQRRAFPPFNSPVPQAPAPQIPGQTLEEDFEIPKGRSFLRAKSSKLRVFTGEAITASYYLYIEEDAHLSSAEIQQLPKLSGFYKEDLFMGDSLQKLSWEGVRVKGKFYKRALLLEYKLFPLGQGKKRIDPVKARVATISQNNMRRQFGFGIPAPHAFPMASRSVDIEVKPLPEHGRPKEFLGAVGNFQLIISPVTKELALNKAFTLTVKVKGEGAFHAIDELSFQAPTSLEFFDTKIQQSRDEKVFEYVFIPRKPGDLVFPEIKLSYFDPKTEKYAVASTQPLQFTVNGQEEPAAPGQSPRKFETTKKDTSHPPISDSFEPTIWETLDGKWLLGLGVALWILGGLFIGLKYFRTHRSSRAPSEPQFQKIAKQWIKNPQRAPTTAEIDKMKFSILEAIRDRFKELNLPHSGKSRSAEIQLDEMAESGLPKPISDTCRQCFLKLDSIAFSSSQKSDISWEQVLEDLNRLLKAIE